MILLSVMKRVPFVWISVLCIGSPAYAIFGGQTVSVDDPLASSVLALVHDFPQGESPAPCGAVVVSSRALLTAAHCVSDVDRVIRLYQTVDLIRTVIRVPRPFRRSPPTLVRREQIHIHHDYQRQRSDAGPNQNADLAVIVFAQGLPWKTTAMAIGDADRFSNLSSVNLAGFGGASMDGEGQWVLQRVSLTRLPNPSPFRLALDQSGGAGICRGDSGGPAFVVDQSGRPILLGVNSVVTGPTLAKACQGRAGVVNVWSHREWLQQFLD